MKKYFCRIRVSWLASLAALAVMLFFSGCAGTRQGTKPQAKAPSAAIRKQEFPQSETLDTYDDHWSDFQSLPFIGMRWEWLGNLTPTETMKVEQPANYLLELKSDGWFNIQTDCKQGEGMYETDDQRIAMAVVKLTDTACPPGSHHDVYLKSLESAGSFRMMGQKLYFDIKNEAKTMVFWRIQ